MSQLAHPSRKAYLREQRERHGRHAFGIFPAQYPREILWAVNVLPMEIWDPPLEVSRANAHLQPYICSVVKLGLELILQGHCAELEGFLFPHTCDSIQNLASIVHDYLGVQKPCYFFYHPKAPYSDASRRFYREELQDLVSRLERPLGPLDPSELKRRVEQGREMNSLLGHIYEMRARGEIRASNQEFYRVVRQNEFLHPDDFIPILERFLASARGEDDRVTRVILSGVLPDPPQLLSLLDECGVRIADDDLLSCSRRLLVPAGAAGDPFDALTEGYFRMGPCSTRDSSMEDRVLNLLGKVKRGGARGVIFNTLKFCEPELFDVPQLVEALRAEGIATLTIDTDLNQGLSGQLSTRVEAFVEMLRS
ncbi:MAG: 2-hydroxyacyl-CoA dehydratase family protein [Thermodesulfobacteriota bacterium]